jgi:hypothetical protein
MTAFLYVIFFSYMNLLLLLLLFYFILWSIFVDFGRCLGLILGVYVQQLTFMLVFFFPLDF